MVETTAKTIRYESYKDSGVEWLGEIPEHWKVKPGFTILSESKKKNTGFIEDTVLSLSYGNVIVKPKEKLTGLVPESFETYQLVEPGDIIIRPTDLQNDKTSLRTGLTKNEGIITSAYINLRVNKENDNSFYHYYLHTIDINKVIYGLGSGLRQNISFWDFKRFPFPSPPLQEQTAIAQFLDHKTTKIDEAITIKEQQISLLKERKQIFIQKAVTRGLNPNVKLKDSGVEWLGKIPEHWEMKKMKFISEIFNGDSLNESLKKKYESDDLSHLAYVSTKNINVNNSVITYNTGLRIPKDGVNLKVAPKNSCLLCIEGGSAGRKIAFTNQEVCFVNKLACFSVKKGYDSKYLFFSLKGSPFQTQFKLSMSGMIGGVAISSINNFSIPIPPLKEQKEISEYIDSISLKIETAINLKQKEIEKLKEYKSSLINSMVTGKVKVC